jgi:molecular chaperone GrpE
MSTDNEQEATTAEQDTQPAAEPEAEEKAVDVEALQQEIEKLKEESAHRLDQWKRAAANLENYRKRVEKERGELLALGQATLFAQLLPVRDDLERALQTVPATLHGLTWIDGIGLIERKLGALFEQYGLEEVDPLGKPFDPAMHQSVLQEQTTQHPDGQVTEVLQKGYRLRDKMLRPAMVKIARNTQTEAASVEERPMAAEGQPDSASNSTAKDQKAENA